MDVCLGAVGRDDCVTEREQGRGRGRKKKRRRERNNSQKYHFRYFAPLFLSVSVSRLSSLKTFLFVSRIFICVCSQFYDNCGSASKSEKE